MLFNAETFFESSAKTKRAAWLTLLAAALLAITSAYCTVTGVIAFLGGSLLALFFMSFVEFAKFMLLYNVHHYWHHKLFKWFYKIPSLVVITITLLISFIGIFGYFTNAHVQQTVGTIGQSTTIINLNEQIKLKEETIKNDQDQINQLSKTMSGHIDGAISKLTANGKITQGLNVQTQYQSQLNRMYKDQAKQRTEISKLKEQLLPLKTDVAKNEVDLAGIKAVASLVGFDLETDIDAQSKAVRIMTLLLMAVFDPSAILLFIIAVWLFKRADEEEDIEKNNKQEENVYRLHINPEELEEEIRPEIDPKDLEPIPLKPLSKANIKKLRRAIKRLNEKPIGVQAEKIEPTLSKPKKPKVKKEVIVAPVKPKKEKVKKEVVVPVVAPVIANQDEVQKSYDDMYKKPIVAESELTEEELDAQEMTVKIADKIGKALIEKIDNLKVQPQTVMNKKDKENEEFIFQNIITKLEENPYLLKDKDVKEMLDNNPELLNRVVEYMKAKDKREFVKAKTEIHNPKKTGWL